jgi:hypothetical protein
MSPQRTISVQDSVMISGLPNEQQIFMVKFHLKLIGSFIVTLSVSVDSLIAVCSTAALERKTLQKKQE